MSLIKINLAEFAVSESAKAKPAYHLVPIGGAQALVIDSKHKSAVTKAVANLKKAKTLGVSAAKLGVATEKLKLKLSQAQTPAKKAPIREKISDNKAAIKHGVTEAKALAKAAADLLKKAGLSALDLSIKASYITQTDPTYTLGKISKAKPDSFRAKYGAHHTVPLKPRYATGDKFDKIGEKIAASGKAPAVKTTKRLVTKPVTKKAAAPKVDEGKKHLNNIYKSSSALRSIIDKLEKYQEKAASAKLYGDADGNIHYDNGKLKLKITHASGNSYVVDSGKRKETLSKASLTSYLSQTVGISAREDKRASDKAAGIKTKRLPKRKPRPLTQYNA
ncbi:hypothetical protein pEaSNUABM13_00199 [Erwinia phage pEa_SNUABM_13]|nr:hypothetical protein pEaSNUABM13_00199 [Erwinia phage pEa_SNUABM_13]QYW05212.1 hypothetical protein pEaSNUABM21_00198 [Erwinia phage pEa_SNUABM_21]